MDCIICFSLSASLITILTFSEKYINKLCCYENNDNENNNNEKHKKNNNILDYDELCAVNNAKTKII